MLGHMNSRITTHYSAAELTSLIAAAEKICDSESHNSPATTWLRRRVGQENPRKDVVAVREIGAPGEIVRRGPRRIPRRLGTKREDAFVQLGVTESVCSNAVPELSNSPTTTV
jgi:hypothetical protein